MKRLPVNDSLSVEVRNGRRPAHKGPFHRGNFTFALLSRKILNKKKKKKNLVEGRVVLLELFDLEI